MYLSEGDPAIAVGIPDVAVLTMVKPADRFRVCQKRIRVGGRQEGSIKVIAISGESAGVEVGKGGGRIDLLCDKI